MNYIYVQMALVAWFLFLIVFYLGLIINRLDTIIKLLGA